MKASRDCVTEPFCGQIISTLWSTRLVSREMMKHNFAVRWRIDAAESPGPASTVGKIRCNPPLNQSRPLDWPWDWRRQYVNEKCSVWHLRWLVSWGHDAASLRCPGTDLCWNYSYCWWVVMVWSSVTIPRLRENKQIRSRSNRWVLRLTIALENGILNGIITVFVFCRLCGSRNGAMDSTHLICWW